MRTARYSIPVDTFSFSPLELQPKTALRLAFGSVSQSVATQIVPWPKLIHQHHWSFVLAGFTYVPGTLQFATAETMLDIAGSLTLRAGRKLVEHTCRIGRDCTVSTLWRPVSLLGTAELSGTPRDADDWLAGHFTEEEQNASRPPRALDQVLAPLEQHPAAATFEYTTLVARDECEVADQWQFVSSVGFAARARETWALEDGNALARASLGSPNKGIVAEMRSPLYFGSRLRVRSKAYPLPTELLFVHEGFDGSFAAAERLSFVLVERFETKKETT